MKTGGRDRRYPVGEYPSVSLAEARKRAARLRSEVLDGHDPIAERRAELAKREAEGASNVAAVLHTYRDLHLANLADGKRRFTQLHGALSQHMTRPVRELTRSDLQLSIDDKAKKAPVAANRLKASLVHFAGWCKARGYISELIAVELSKPVRERPRDRVLSMDEIAAIWCGTFNLSRPWGSLVRLLILTAQRRGDVAGMPWCEVESTRWTIPALRTKNRRPQIVHLSPAALKELDTIRGEMQDHGGLVFTFTGCTPVSGFGEIKARLDELSKVADWRLHDLRTAFASHCAEAGLPEGVVDRVLNHAASASSASAVARVYQRSELLSQRAEALDRWADMVLAASERASNDVSEGERTAA